MYIILSTYISKFNINIFLILELIFMQHLKQFQNKMSITCIVPNLMLSLLALGFVNVNKSYNML
jgi:hypothetical protein